MFDWFILVCADTSFFRLTTFHQGLNIASVSGLGSPQSSAGGGFSGSLSILYLIKRLPNPEKQDLPLDLVLSCMSGWSTSGWHWK